MKKFNCKTCGYPIKNRDTGVVVWSKYNGNFPSDYKVVHKLKWGNRDECDPEKSNYSYEITDFIKDFPTLAKTL